jgi:RNA polymerase sigma-70 factor (ECF subfamily)
MDWFDHKKVENRFERLASPGNAEEYSPDEATIAAETELIAQLVVGHMPKTRREVFTMVTEDGLSIDEAAQRLHVTKATVSTHLYHARQELRKFLTALLVFAISLFV